MELRSNEKKAIEVFGLADNDESETLRNLTEHKVKLKPLRPVSVICSIQALFC